MTGRGKRAGQHWLCAGRSRLRFMDLAHVKKNAFGPAGGYSKPDQKTTLRWRSTALSQTPADIKKMLNGPLPPGSARQSQGRSLGGGNAVERFFPTFKIVAAGGFVEANGKLTDDGLWAAHLRLDDPLHNGPVSEGKCLSRK